MNLYMQYRPMNFQEVVGQSKAIKKIERILERGWGGRAWWLNGLSGTGKTTLAGILARIESDEHNVTYLEANALTVSKLGKIEDLLRFHTWGDKPGRAFIIDEAHRLSKDTISKLLTMLENIDDQTCWIFTTTVQGERKLMENATDAAPLLSRCMVVELSRSGLTEAFAKHCHEIAHQQGLNGQPVASYETLATDCGCNMRMMLQQIESGIMLDAYLPGLGRRW